MSDTLGDSSQEQTLLRPIALWAAQYAAEALKVFEGRHPDDSRPRQAVEAGREFGQGKKRDKHLRMVAFAAMKAGKDTDQASKHAAQSAMLTAAVAYTHTDLQTGVQGVRQARHILGPVTYAALALEAATDDSNAADDLIQRAIKTAPLEVERILSHMPLQPQKSGRADMLFLTLDTSLRTTLGSR